MEQQRNDTATEKPKDSKRNQSQYHFDHDKYHMDQQITNIVSQLIQAYSYLHHLFAQEQSEEAMCSVKCGGE
jgi:Na+-transporting NADH:ubiquinone oxidoreductase subunit NqrF